MQRTFIAIVTVALFILGALLGTPGQMPIGEDGNFLTPEFFSEFLAPFGLFLGTLKFLFDAVNKRVVDGTLEPSNLVQLLKLKEFWAGILGALVAVVQLFFRVEIMTPEQQATLASGIQIVVALLLQSWDTRSPGADAPPTPQG